MYIITIPVDLQISNIQIRITESPVGSKLLARESVSPVKPSARDCRLRDYKIDVLTLISTILINLYLTKWPTHWLLGVHPPRIWRQLDDHLVNRLASQAISSVLPGKVLITDEAMGRPWGKGSEHWPRENVGKRPGKLGREGHATRSQRILNLLASRKSIIVFPFPTMIIHKFPWFW